MSDRTSSDANSCIVVHLELKQYDEEFPSLFALVSILRVLEIVDFRHLPFTVSRPLRPQHIGQVDIRCSFHLLVILTSPHACGDDLQEDLLHIIAECLEIFSVVVIFAYVYFIRGLVDELFSMVEAEYTHHSLIQNLIQMIIRSFRA